MPKPKRLLPDFYNSKDPNNEFVLWARSQFLNALANSEDTLVSDALAREPFAVYKLYGPSHQLDVALSTWAGSFSIDFPFVVEAATKTLHRWIKYPSVLARKSWALSSGSGWPHLNVGDAIVRTPQKKQRDERDEWFAFTLLVERHVFGHSNYKLAKKYELGPAAVSRHVTWASDVLGITPYKSWPGRPRKS